MDWLLTINQPELSHGRDGEISLKYTRTRTHTYLRKVFDSTADNAQRRRHRFFTAPRERKLHRWNFFLQDRCESSAIGMTANIVQEMSRPARPRWNRMMREALNHTHSTIIIIIYYQRVREWKGCHKSTSCNSSSIRYDESFTSLNRLGGQLRNSRRCFYGFEALYISSVFNVYRDAIIAVDDLRLVCVLGNDELNRFINWNRLISISTNTYCGWWIIIVFGLPYHILRYYYRVFFH